MLNVIIVTGINGRQFYINGNHIATIDQTPQETTIALIDGRMLSVKEPACDVVAAMTFKR